MKTRLPLIYMSFLMIGVLTLASCAPKKKMDIQDKAQVEEPTDLTDEAVPTPGMVQITQDWAEIPALSVVNFDFDSATLNEAARTVLRSNVEILKKLPTSVTVRVEGHCDDRGTIEYNVALGQRRANAVSNFYRTAGFPRNRINTISYGEERPICREQSEGCWERNRRGVTTVRNEQPLSVDPTTLR